MVARRSWRLAERLTVAPPWRPVPLNRTPILMIGNQKAGTSAIAGLLGKATNSSATIDLLGELVRPSIPRVLAGEITLDQFLKHNAVDFSRDIVKDCHMTFLVDELTSFLPEAQTVFIVRAPQDNIRSILNRLGLEGTCKRVPREVYRHLGPGWRLVLDGGSMGLSNSDVIETLAVRWARMAEIYLRSRDTMTLARYEDFVQDKVGFVSQLAERLNLDVVRDISEIVDQPFQRPGMRNVIWKEFFGEENLALIEEVTRAQAEALDY